MSTWGSPSINKLVQNNGNRILNNFEQDQGFDSNSTTTSIMSTDAVAYPGILFEGGVQQIQLRTEDRENRDLGTVAP